MIRIRVRVVVVSRLTMTATGGATPLIPRGVKRGKNSDNSRTPSLGPTGPGLLI